MSVVSHKLGGCISPPLTTETLLTYLLFALCPRFISPPLTTKGPTTRLSVIRHQKPLKVRLSRRLNASAGRGSPHPSSCTPPTNLGLVGARTARHDREPGGLQVRVRVSLAEEKGHQEAALLAELYCKEQLQQKALLPEADLDLAPQTRENFSLGTASGWR